MAKITVTIEDAPNGQVKCVADPSFEQLMGLDATGQGWTSAQGYAVFLLNQLRMASKELEKKHNPKILLPKIGR